MGKPKGESRGLAYLRSARPEAVHHLLRFFGESGKHLEPKTRFLISVVTKVINFSPRGLVQYVRRALDAGASAEEILDAILCAYPCAGLTRVVDAVDVVLDMGIPEFEALAAPDDPPSEERDPRGGEREESGRWIDVGASAELPEGGALQLVAGSCEIAVYRLGGELLAIDNACPHGKGGQLARGLLSGDVVTCPLHAWKFHLPSGRSVTHPGIGVRVHPVRVNDQDRIEVQLP